MCHLEGDLVTQRFWSVALRVEECGWLDVESWPSSLVDHDQFDVARP